MDKILVIDDEKATLAMLRLLLSAYGYTVLTAENGPAGLEVCKKERPPIVLSDIKMPGMDGIQVLQKIKEENGDTEVIMVTGQGDIELAIQSLKFDAADFITKPINNDALEVALKRVNEKITLKAELRKYTESLEHLVEEKTKKLIKAERLAAVGQTVAGLTHAIKNMAGGLRGGAFVLEKGFELNNEKYLRQGWKMVKRNVGRINEMALDLLNYTKDREPEYRQCNPNSPFREVFDLMLPRARAQGITLMKDLDIDLSQVWFDPEGIHRCLLNLVTNAIDACTDINCANKKAEIVIRSLKPEGWAVEYQVVDNGCGIDEGTRNQLFQSFFSTKGSRGTGLGLMITKKIIDEHGGIIEMESEKDKGTKFFIRLPERVF
ncbi:MAG: response regulator [Deltaproteobacteria bacterium]|nr:response regulator [Deltaproteobacteria bacterium]